ncbi:G-type lectin S-receptor-like serine/threonine-protein kinase At5g35370 [Nymphaea colorata]|uniref:G-type lectin S-receptor-like serine/threonine-protein kinase At5g35370 n=1 Tax=Nymphaea colorata TaxID=210225 RepID=UPI00129DB5D9|nr:G-type lectin S-receptor-like serine/threonine-protein kinase At5g35370 [Nymphaea colorata]XP_049935038.1 G-type lectin S-receptor-like serine/threonine-protein kinase At5g35370 [Nymphaea colorata]XP_049935039.1 G-type lectin S-receptor-like serine/threonine-protein kinase At5g35370 [Nymphaea colorata]XP_049935040.1 G-type lectin S-receptor-like serine/threonine-protein kinase At5g35370 [Nymphaea colorata]XP_049935041.1 G-type lectin S-receptor-like serine/threonine-protein kinase At5g35370 
MMAPASFPCMFLFLLSFFALRCLGGPISTEFIRPNFTATNLGFVDNNGVFLASKSNIFRASICNPAGDGEYYLCVLHVESNQVVWSANRGSPVTNADRIVFLTTGIFIYGANGSLVWWTKFRSQADAVSLVHLQDTGNLQLLDSSNSSIWESFDHPTDTILMGQKLPLGVNLIGSISKNNLASGDYALAVTKDDALLQWKGHTYWRITMDPRAFKDQNADITYMQVNGSGLYLFAAGGGNLIVVWRVILSPAKLRLLTLDSSGKLRVQSYSRFSWNTEFLAPASDCSVPLWCGSLGICSDSGGANNNSYCTCPDQIPAANRSDLSKGCTLSGQTDFCSSTSSSPSIDYLALGTGIDYFEDSYSQAVNPLNGSSDISDCRKLCSANCSCLGYFYNSDFGSCFLVREVVGSLQRTGDKSMSGYLKTISHDFGVQGGKRLPLAALILLPAAGILLLTTICALVLSWRRMPRKQFSSKTSYPNSNESDEDIDLQFVPGLPKKFSLSQLESATNNFSVKIGSGGFGAVYKGILEDGTQVAVKKINNVGVQGKREFYTEIATIGSIHHVNLVRLHGFCAEAAQRLLVYEYMNLGSLDRSLFSQSTVMEWSERVEIAIGTARGLSYLHSSCQPKIIHCDIKPENILLNDPKQIKLSDFGLSKLLTLEQSNLFTTMRGTRGYLAPEWLTNSAISEKTDVYSYGMVLLEIIRGRKNCSAAEDEGEANVYFPMYALDMHEQGRYLELVDPRLADKVKSEEVERMVKVALCCVQEEPWLRPSMGTVVGMLDGVLPLCEPRVQSLTFLRFYGRRFSEPSTLLSGSSPAAGFSLGSTGSSFPASFSPSVASAQQVSGPR